MAARNARSTWHWFWRRRWGMWCKSVRLRQQTWTSCGTSWMTSKSARVTAPTVCLGTRCSTTLKPTPLASSNWAHGITSSTRPRKTVNSLKSTRTIVTPSVSNTQKMNLSHKSGRMGQKARKCLQRRTLAMTMITMTKIRKRQATTKVTKRTASAKV